LVVNVIDAISERVGLIPKDHNGLLWWRHGLDEVRRKMKYRLKEMSWSKKGDFVRGTSLN
jgi:hypothetical protein